MNILVKFYAVDIPVSLKSTSFDLPDGSVVEDALEECLKLPEITIDEDYFKASTVLKNGGRTDLKDTLSDGDVLSILRTMEGG